VQDGTLLGDVDLLAMEQAVDVRPQIGLLGELQEELERLVGDAVLRVVQEDADGLGGQALAAPRIVGEELPEMQTTDRPGVGFEGLPCRPLGERRAACCHPRSPFRASERGTASPRDIIPGS
jgi:hypothetical protein